MRLQQRIGCYSVTAELGHGGMGIVYTAQDPRLKRTVAIKLLPPDLTRDETAKQRFLQEAQAASALDHPNICAIYEINETDDGQLYLVMAHYEGETLQARIARGPLALDDAIDMARQMGTGLAEAHGAGIVHRDIKPANFFVTKTGVAKLVRSEGVLTSGVSDMIGLCSPGPEPGSSARSSRSAFTARSRGTSTTPMRTIPMGRWRRRAWVPSRWIAVSSPATGSACTTCSVQ